MSKTPTHFDDRYARSSYEQFVKQAGVPLYEGSALEDLATLELKEWERTGGKAAYTRLTVVSDLPELPNSPSSSVAPK